MLTRQVLWRGGLGWTVVTSVTEHNLQFRFGARRLPAGLSDTSDSRHQHRWTSLSACPPHTSAGFTSHLINTMTRQSGCVLHSAAPSLLTAVLCAAHHWSRIIRLVTRTGLGRLPHLVTADQRSNWPVCRYPGPLFQCWPSGKCPNSVLP